MLHCEEKFEALGAYMVNNDDSRAILPASFLRSLLSPPPSPLEREKGGKTRDPGNEVAVPVATLSACYISKKKANRFGLTSQSPVFVKVCPLVNAVAK